LDTIIDEIGEDEAHPLADLAEALSFLSKPTTRPTIRRQNLLRGKCCGFLMEQNDLNQSDLPELGSQGVVSEILSGKRSLNVKQISRLAKRFSVSPGVLWKPGTEG